MPIDAESLRKTVKRGGSLVKDRACSIKRSIKHRLPHSRSHTLSEFRKSSIKPFETLPGNPILPMSSAFVEENEKPYNKHDLNDCGEKSRGYLKPKMHLNSTASSTPNLYVTLETSCNGDEFASENIRSRTLHRTSFGEDNNNFYRCSSVGDDKELHVQTRMLGPHHCFAEIKLSPKSQRRSINSLPNTDSDLNSFRSIGKDMYQLPQVHSRHRPNQRHAWPHKSKSLEQHFDDSDYRRDRLLKQEPIIRSKPPLPLMKTRSIQTEDVRDNKSIKRPACFMEQHLRRPLSRERADFFNPGIIQKGKTQSLDTDLPPNTGGVTPCNVLAVAKHFDALSPKSEVQVNDRAPDSRESLTNLDSKPDSSTLHGRQQTHARPCMGIQPLVRSGYSVAPRKPPRLNAKPEFSTGGQSTTPIDCATKNVAKTDEPKVADQSVAAESRKAVHRPNDLPVFQNDVPLSSTVASERSYETQANVAKHDGPKNPTRVDMSHLWSKGNTESANVGLSLKSKGLPEKQIGLRPVTEYVELDTYSEQEVTDTLTHSMIVDNDRRPAGEVTVENHPDIKDSIKRFEHLDLQAKISSQILTRNSRKEPAPIPREANAETVTFSSSNESLDGAMARKRPSRSRLDSSVSLSSLNSGLKAGGKLVTKTCTDKNQSISAHYISVCKVRLARQAQNLTVDLVPAASDSKPNESESHCADKTADSDRLPWWSACASPDFPTILQKHGPPEKVRIQSPVQCRRLASLLKSENDVDETENTSCKFVSFDIEPDGRNGSHANLSDNKNVDTSIQDRFATPRATLVNESVYETPDLNSKNSIGLPADLNNNVGLNLNKEKIPQEYATKKDSRHLFSTPHHKKPVLKKTKNVGLSSNSNAAEDLSVICMVNSCLEHTEANSSPTDFSKQEFLGSGEGESNNRPTSGHAKRYVTAEGSISDNDHSKEPPALYISPKVKKSCLSRGDNASASDPLYKTALSALDSHDLQVSNIEKTEDRPLSIESIDFSRSDNPPSANPEFTEDISSSCMPDENLHNASDESSPEFRKNISDSHFNSNPTSMYWDFADLQPNESAFCASSNTKSTFSMPLKTITNNGDDGGSSGEVNSTLGSSSRARQQKISISVLKGLPEDIADIINTYQDKLGTLTCLLLRDADLLDMDVVGKSLYKTPTDKTLLVTSTSENCETTTDPSTIATNENAVEDHEGESRETESSSRQACDNVDDHLAEQKSEDDEIAPVIPVLSNDLKYWPFADADNTTSSSNDQITSSSKDESSSANDASMDSEIVEGIPVYPSISGQSVDTYETALSSSSGVSMSVDESPDTELDRTLEFTPDVYKNGCLESLDQERIFTFEPAENLDETESPSVDNSAYRTAQINNNISLPVDCSFKSAIGSSSANENFGDLESKLIADSDVDV